MARPRSGALAVVVLLAATACATAAPQSVERAAEGQRYRVTGTVLESPDHGPQLCKLVKDSNPPQCEGMEIVGWDWSKVDAESNSGTTWGGYTLVGTYDGERFTLTEPAAKPSGPRPPPEDDVTFDTPCPEPEGGWRVVDESRFGMEAQHLVDKRTRSAPDFAGMWVDYPYLDPAELKDPAAAERSGALRNFVLNVRFTGDLAGREEWIREVWGGALCVSQAKYTLQELSRSSRSSSRNTATTCCTRTPTSTPTTWSSRCTWRPTSCRMGWTQSTAPASSYSTAGSSPWSSRHATAARRSPCRHPLLAASGA